MLTYKSQVNRHLDQLAHVSGSQSGKPIVASRYHYFFFFYIYILIRGDKTTYTQTLTKDNKIKIK